MRRSVAACIDGLSRRVLTPPLPTPSPSQDKAFELEMSWVCAESGWLHQRVPKDVAGEATQQALAAIAAAMED